MIFVTSDLFFSYNIILNDTNQTGVRVGELAALKWEYIDWENGTLHIQRIETRAFNQEINNY